VTKLRLPLRLYVLATIATGSAALILAALADRGRPAESTALSFVVLVVLAAAAKSRPVHLSLKLKMTVDDAPIFAAALLLGPFLAMIVAGAATLVGLRFGTKMPLYNRLFNSASSSLSAGAAATGYIALSKTEAPLAENLGAVVIAALAGYAVQTVLVDTAVTLQLRRNPFVSWWRVHRTDLLPQAILYAFGAAAALSAAGDPWVLPLIVLPMGLVLVLIREWTKMRARTRAALVQLADLIDKRDRYTYGHSQRVADLANRLATRMCLAPSQVDLITEAARLHDIGKVTTPDEVLQKSGALEPHEWDVMHQHSEAGYKLLQELSDFWEGAELVRAHHERPDGRGYPRGARGLELPLEASIISACDAYDAMTSDRVYRKALPWPSVRAELLAGRGTQWHAQVVDALLAMLEVEGALAGAGTHPRARSASPLPTPMRAGGTVSEGSAPMWHVRRWLRTR
jgi:putative nucleotidyltransferase with HDIG domain